jgi:hypothetical protein
VTPETRARRGASFGGGLEVVVVSLGGDHEVEAWLYPIEGRLEVAEITLRQAPPPSRSLSRGGDIDGPAFFEEYQELRRRADRVREHLDGRCVPLSTTVLRELSLSRVMEEARTAKEHLPRRRHQRIAQVEPVAVSQGMTTTDSKLLPYANDALLVSSLLGKGDRAPARALSDLRGVSVRSAQGRVARARSLGMLTQVAHGVTGGQLTDAAKRIVAEAMEISTAMRAMDEDTEEADG